MASTRRLAAILAADVAGYSRLMGADEEGTHERFKAHFRELVDPKIAEHHGRIVKNTGYGFLAEFASVVDAVRCAVEVQRGMVDRNEETPEDERITFRIGINLGDVIVEEDDIYGDGVNIAARLEGLAEPDGICISRVVREQIQDKLPYPFESKGEQNVKNIRRPVRVYALRLEAVAGRPASSTPTATPIPQSAKVPRLSIVVLPFANLSNDPEQQYLADGITEDLTTDLSRIAGMVVISRNTAFTYRDKPIHTKQIGRELGVRYVLEGSVRRSANQVRVNAQLIEAETEAHVWAERFTGDLGDLFALQDEITSRIAIALDFALVRAEAARPNSKPERIGLRLPGSRGTGEIADTRQLCRGDWLVRTCLGARSAIRRGPALAGAGADRSRARWHEQHGGCRHRPCGRFAGASFRGLTRHCICTLRQRQFAARTAPIRRRDARIRDGDRAGSQLSGIVCQSRAVETVRRGISGGHPDGRTGHPPQSARRRPRRLVPFDWDNASAAIAYRRSDRLARKGAQCQSRTPGSPRPPCRSLWPHRRNRTCRRRARRSPEAER